MNQIKKRISFYSLISLNLISLFLIQVIIYRKYGLGEVTDSYATGLIFATITMSMVISSIEGIWLPKLSASRFDLFNQTVSLAIGNSILYSFIFNMIAGLVSFMLLDLLFGNLSAQSIDLSKQLLIPFFVSSFLLSISAFTQVILRSIKKSLISELVGSISALTSLLLIMTFIDFLTISDIVWISALRAILIILTIWIYLEKPMVKFSSLSEFRLILTRKLPLSFSSMLSSSNVFVDRVLAGNIGIAGSLAIINLLGTITKAPIKFLDTAFSNPRGSTFGQIINQNRTYLINSYLKIYLTSAILITPLILFFLDIYKEPTINFFSFVLNIEKDQSIMLVSLLKIILIFVFMMPLKNLLIKALNAFEKTNLTSLIISISFIIGIVVKISLVEIYQLEGIVIGIAISSILEVIFFYAFYLKVYKHHEKIRK